MELANEFVLHTIDTEITATLNDSPSERPSSAASLGGVSGKQSTLISASGTSEATLLMFVERSNDFPVRAAPQVGVAA